ncbi:thioredoxin family protein [Elizabethkingia sp. YR214]|uniref:thioredoxin family protein n=1 Tax=Elizabethkingia sp. YR214 TaxID=2135667 RepID=UPI0011B20C52|nr:thioredoxin family protein [Elizabethkingia sp. YR214]
MMYSKIKIMLMLFLAGLGLMKGQNIEMYFPYLTGKSYEFIIFQGAEQKVIMKGIIPREGKFRLTIPKEYAPYTGMSRWLITGTKEGGGLDMFIPGKDFSVSNEAPVPDEQNIIYSGNTGNKDLNELYRAQNNIMRRYEIMQQAIKLYSQSDINYNVFKEEAGKQQKTYERFQNNLKEKSDYISHFVPILNLPDGKGTRLFEKEEDRVDHIARYIAEELDWEVLYTSGYWNRIVDTWVSIHLQLLKDKDRFTREFKKISSRISTPKNYTGFVERVAYNLNLYGEDEYIGAIAPQVSSSDKITSYKGPLAVFIKGVIGSEAPDLVLSGYVTGAGEVSKTSRLKMDKQMNEMFDSSLIVFYQSDCKSCTDFLQQLSEHYADLRAKSIRVIAISADRDSEVFKSKAQSFPWKDNTYCNYKGVEGDNFQNYGVSGAPTLVWVDNNGKILSRGSSFSLLSNTN